ncbi:MAG: 2,3-bisphosphoglycerate-independent phosphoglycerate mutase [Planctomycetota bacterium]|nr:2,3-bisphosphoglycerate-independent phosphoglycerate mutase [Planctomycetota bacterium]
MGCPEHLVRSEGGRIGLFVLDGLGGLPHPDHGATELEAAATPHLDELATRSSLGRIQLLPPGITPGSGPGHLSLFGHDPMQLEFGRGLLEALGSGYPLAPGEIAARGNFCTIDDAGLVTDRRAGRPADAECVRLCQLLSEQVSVDGAKVQLLPGKEHRFTWVLTGDGLGAGVNDNDPQLTGRAPLPFAGRDDASGRTATLASQWLQQATAALKDETVANSALLRGFSTRPAVPTFEQLYHLKSGALAIYPMYRGVAQLVGMEPLDAGENLADQAAALTRALESGFDFVFVHHKDTDTAGHSGDFAAKVAAIEAFDAALPSFMAAGLDVIAITGDHATPTTMKEHSWHPVPLLVHSQRALPVGGVPFHDRGCVYGDIGTIRGPELMPLLLAHADRLDKYGA